jgi:hypothetical protein
MESLVEFLLHPSSYPERPSRIDLVQTHISWVFIGDAFVYKVKKPVNFGFLDFTSLAKRKFYVEEELRLNARFSPDVYLAVVPVSRNAGGYILGDDRDVVDYALKMRRINEEKMLHRLLEADRVSAADMERIAGHLASVYHGISSDEKARGYGSLETVATNVTENFEQTRKYSGSVVAAETFRAIESWSLDFMKHNASVFERRIAGGHIKECHGDLHLQHICMEKDAIIVFDCIEFNERFRYGDVAADVAFLAMDLDYNRRSDLAEAFVNGYVAASGDRDLMNVLMFYRVYRAYVRAKVTSFLLDDQRLSAAAHAEAGERARAYYNLAYLYVTRGTSS